MRCNLINTRLSKISNKIDSFTFINRFRFEYPNRLIIA